MRYICPQGCVKDVGMSKPPPGDCPGHGPFIYEKQLKRSGPLRQVSPKRQAEEDAGARPRRRGSTLNAGRGFAVADAQREKVKGLVCIGCGREASDWLAIDPAHLLPRGVGGCDDPLCVGPLCREPNGEGCHRLYDEGKLDLLPRLIDGKYFAEMAHMVSVHELGFLTAIERVTGERWQPVPDLSAPTQSEEKTHA